MAEPRATLLFVDDELDVLELLSKMFERRFNVLTAGKADDALSILRGQHVDLLITDQKMPEMTGIQLVAAARAEGIDVPAVLLTAYTDPEDLIAAINQGQVYRYITKPWDVNDLLITVKNAVEYGQLRREKDRLLKQLEKRVEALSVLYEVSQQSASDAPTYDAIIDRVLTAVARVLPYECGAALVTLDEGRNASLKLRCNGVGDKGLLSVKEAVLAAHRKQTGQLLPEDRVITRVGGSASQEASAPSFFPSQLTVPLVARGIPVGTLSLFASRPNAYSSEDGQLLDILANQTTEAIQSLRASEDQARRRIERMVDSMADGVLLTDEKNEIVVINQAAKKLLHLGDDPAQSTAKHLQETLGFYPFELVRGWEYGGSQVLREELRIFDRAVHSTVTPVSDGRGSLKGVVVVLRDITEQKQIEERKEEFVSIISHELRTPLTSISGALDLVLNFLAGEINEKQQRYLAMAKESTDKLNAVVDDLLDLSKFAKGKLRMSFEFVQLDDLVRRSLEKYGPALLEKKIRLVTQLPEGGVRSLVDPNRLNQVLHNLLTNAVKFTPEEGEIKLELGAPRALPGYVSLSLWNSGEAIPETELERIFDKFEQARSPRTRTVRGTGLGLAICRNIVEAHGGRIWAEPTTEGARFALVIPVEPPSELRTEAGEDAAPPVSRPMLRRGKVLIVESDLHVALAAKAALMVKDFEVILARRGDEALAKARRLRPDLVVIDAQLPDLDGLRLLEIFRNDPETRHAPVLVTSVADERSRAFRIGASAFLLKPIQAEVLVGTLDSLAKGQVGRQQGRVLIVDDDANICAICMEVLSNQGFEVITAGSLAEARTAMSASRPDVLLLDLALPDGDGFSFLEELKAERASAHLPVLFISARAETSAKVRALKLGGDDYLTKPFDAIELGARVESVLRRKEQELGSSPTTQLPGSGAIEREVQRRLRAKEPFAFCYLDLDNLKAYNDYYGFAKADGVVRQTGDLLREIVAQEGTRGDFLGHVAGDDFVFITDPSTADPICRRGIEVFDQIIPLYYDRQDRERGYIEAEDRFGERRRFPIMSVSVVAVMCDGVRPAQSELAKIAAELKKRAKAIQGSVYLRSDRELAARPTG